MKDVYSFSSTSIGYSHIISKKPCQDFSMAFENEEICTVVVSDGHGSANFTRSDRGSRFACESAICAIKEFVTQIDANQLKNEHEKEFVVLQLCKNIILRWNTMVKEDYLNEPFSVDEVADVAEKYKTLYLNGEKYEHAYGCTLLIILYAKDYFLAIRNGDGECVTLSQDALFSMPIPWNDKCEVNITTSLCDDSSIDDFRYYYSESKPIASFIGSDGIDNSYASKDDLFNLYLALCVDAVKSGVEVIKENVDLFLPSLTKRGSTDDVSIAGIINKTELSKISTLLLTENEKRKNSAQEEAICRQNAIKKRDENEKYKKAKKLEEEKKRLEVELTEKIERHNNMLRKSSFLKENADALMEEINKAEERIEEIKAILHSSTETLITRQVEKETVEDQESSLSDTIETDSEHCKAIKNTVIILDEESNESDAKA